ERRYLRKFHLEFVDKPRAAKLLAKIELKGWRCPICHDIARLVPHSIISQIREQFKIDDNVTFPEFSMLISKISKKYTVPEVLYWFVELNSRCDGIMSKIDIDRMITLLILSEKHPDELVTMLTVAEIRKCVHMFEIFSNDWRETVDFSMLLLAMKIDKENHQDIKQYMITCSEDGANISISDFMRIFALNIIFERVNHLWI
ncbi:hypothetical protein GJ496_009670, partial [Pomphorhynchus laevis]